MSRYHPGPSSRSHPNERRFLAGLEGRIGAFHLADLRRIATALLLIMTPLYVLLWGSWLVFGLSAAWALVWAINRGQLSDPRTGSLSVFDEDEIERMGEDHG